MFVKYKYVYVLDKEYENFIFIPKTFRLLALFGAGEYWNCRLKITESDVSKTGEIKSINRIDNISELPQYIIEDYIVPKQLETKYYNYIALGPYFYPLPKHSKTILISFTEDFDDIDPGNLMPCEFYNHTAEIKNGEIIVKEELISNMPILGGKKKSKEKSKDKSKKKIKKTIK